MKLIVTDIFWNAFKGFYHLNPLKLTYGLAEQCLAKGINIYENSPLIKCW